MKSFVAWCFFLSGFIASAQQPTIAFRLSNEDDLAVKNATVYRKHERSLLGTTDRSGVIHVSGLCSGDTLILSVASCADFTFVVPEPMPAEMVQLQSRCTLSPMSLPAEYPGGKAAMVQFFKENFQYPQVAIDQGISGKVWLRFAIDHEGNLIDVKVKRGVPDCPECDKEAVRLAKLMPKWFPAVENDKPVKSYYEMPVIFKMQ